MKSMYEYYHRVFAAYRRQFGVYADLPSNDIEYFTKNKKEYARLRNFRGTLAIYEINKDSSLKYDENETEKSK